GEGQEHAHADDRERAHRGAEEGGPEGEGQDPHHHPQGGSGVERDVEALGLGTGGRSVHRAGIVAGLGHGRYGTRPWTGRCGSPSAPPPGPWSSAASWPPSPPGTWWWRGAGRWGGPWPRWWPPPPSSPSSAWPAGRCAAASP